MCELRIIYSLFLFLFVIVYKNRKNYQKTTIFKHKIYKERKGRLGFLSSS